MRMIIVCLIVLLVSGSASGIYYGGSSPCGRLHIDKVDPDTFRVARDADVRRVVNEPHVDTVDRDTYKIDYDADVKKVSNAPSQTRLRIIPDWAKLDFSK